MRLKSESDKRLIVQCTVNGKYAYFLIDTGAAIGLMDYNQRKKYCLEKGKAYHGKLVGVGGEMNNVYYCNTFVNIENKTIPQFLLADISDIVKSIKLSTGIEILGIIGLPQMAMIGMNIDVNSNEFWLEQ